MMQLYYSSKFERAYKKLPQKIKSALGEKEALLRKNPFNSTLNTHKLSGRLEGYWAFWIDQKYRVIFEFSGKNILWLHSVGDHSIYR